MKKLRLLITHKCNKKCLLCCNNNFDLSNLPVCKSFKDYSEISLTGGEPLLYPRTVVHVCRTIQWQNSKAKIYLYTADVKALYKLLIVGIIPFDGITLSLHSQFEASLFSRIDKLIDIPAFMSLRLKVFEDIHIRLPYNQWKTEYDTKWVENCPLPKDEDFMSLYHHIII